MGCFCRMTMTPLASELSKLRKAAPAETDKTEPDKAEQAATEKVTALADWLAARGLPAAPWKPDPAWRALRLPTPQMSPAALTTISGLTHLRAEALRQCGTDLLDPTQAEAFRRVVATMNERFRKQPPPPVDPRDWTQLARQNDTADRLAQAMKEGLLKPTPQQQQEYNEPAGVPMREWGGLLRPLRQLAPLIAAARQLDADEEDPAQLAEGLRKLSRVKLPPLAEPERMEELGRVLSAAQRLRTSLGEDTLEQGLAAVRERVRKKVAALARALERDYPGAADEPVEHMLARLPKLAVTPTPLATPAVVEAARKMEKLAAVTWKVPEDMPLVREGLATSRLIEHMKTALGNSPVRATPCGSQCDAAALLRAANMATAA